jgi:hypothetical protein
MRNVHLLPTDKPSRIRIGNNGNFVFGLMQNSIASKNDSYTNQNIYITSNEEIKMDDWYLDDTNSVRQAITECESYWTHRKDYQKIILTTDASLDGVQAIDDEFLEWFVKNPSCDEVEVILQHQYQTSKKYYINPDYVNCTKEQYNSIKSEIPTCPLRIVYQIILPQEEPKQETLEDSIYQAIGLAANEQGIINQALATSKVMDVLKKQIYETKND